MVCSHRVLKPDDVIKIKFVKLLDSLGYSERKTCQKLAFWRKLSLRYKPSYALMIPYKSLFDLGVNALTQVKFRRICLVSSEQNWANISETICPTMLAFGKFFSQNILTNPIISEN